MMMEALKVLNTLGAEHIKSYCDELVGESIQKLRDHGFWIEDTDFRASNLFGIRLPGHLSMKEAKLRVQKAQVFVSYRGDCIRVSPNIYNTKQDLEILVDALTT